MKKALSPWPSGQREQEAECHLARPGKAVDMESGVQGEGEQKEVGP